MDGIVELNSIGYNICICFGKGVFLHKCSENVQFNMV